MKRNDIIRPFETLEEAAARNAIDRSVRYGIWFTTDEMRREAESAIYAAVHNGEISLYLVTSAYGTDPTDAEASMMTARYVAAIVRRMGGTVTGCRCRNIERARERDWADKPSCPYDIRIDISLSRDDRRSASNRMCVEGDIADYLSHQ